MKRLVMIFVLALSALLFANAMADKPENGVETDSFLNEVDNSVSDEDAIAFGDEGSDNEESEIKKNLDIPLEDLLESLNSSSNSSPRFFNGASKEVIDKANQIFDNPDYRQALLDAIRLVANNPGVYFPYEVKEGQTYPSTRWHPIEWVLSTGRNRELTSEEVKIYRQIQDEAANAAFELANKTSDPQLRLAKLDDVLRQYPASSIAPAIALELGDALAEQSAALFAADYWLRLIRPEILGRKRLNSIKPHWELFYPSDKIPVSEAEIAARLVVLEMLGGCPNVLKKTSKGETELDAFKRLYPNAKGVVNAKKIVIDPPEIPFPEAMTQYEGKKVVLAGYLTEFWNAVKNKHEDNLLSNNLSLQDEPNDPEVTQTDSEEDWSMFETDELKCNQFGLYDVNPVELNGSVYPGKFLYYHVYDKDGQSGRRELPLCIHPSNGLVVFTQGEVPLKPNQLPKGEEAQSVLYSGRVPKDFKPVSNWLVCIDRSNGNKVLWTRAWNNAWSVWGGSGIFHDGKFFIMEFCRNDKSLADHSDFKAVYLHCLDEKTGKSVYRTKILSGVFDAYDRLSYNNITIVNNLYFLNEALQRSNYSSVFKIDRISCCCFARIIDGKPVYYILGGGCCAN